MKTFEILKNMGLVLFLGLTAVACSSDDNKDSGESDHFKNVPKGEIVSVEKRFVTLTGYEENTVVAKSVSTLNADTQKWWKYLEAYFEYECDGEYEKEKLEEDGTYYAFYPNGKIYYKSGATGTPVPHHSWAWVDDTKLKVKITPSEGSSAIFEFTELNSKSVVYASYQSEHGCNVLTWEHLVESGN